MLTQYFYNHYDSIEALLYQLIDETLDAMKRQIRKPYEQLAEVDFAISPQEDVSLFYYIYGMKLRVLFRSVKARMPSEHSVVFTGYFHY